MQEQSIIVTSLRQQAEGLFREGVTAADPYRAVASCLHYRDEQLQILHHPHDEQSMRASPWHGVHLIAFGKAACAMADAAQNIIPPELQIGSGIAVTNYENAVERENFEVIAAGHPLPDASGLRGAKAIAQKARQAKAEELVLVLVSGGGSALIPYPADPLTLADKIAATELLLACGADIKQINCVRKHLSVLKGGGLARLAAPADLHALILSDVLGDDLSSIASGPTVPDPTTYADAINVFKHNNVWEQVPGTVKQHLLAGNSGRVPDTPKPGDPMFQRVAQTLIGSNGISLDAVRAAASLLGLSTTVYSTALCGEARTEAEQLVKAVFNGVHMHDKAPLAVIAGGETTVTLKGHGRGGRNQEMALAFALAAEHHAVSYPWVFLSGGTDGRDGPTDAAGGIVDPGTVQRIRAAGGNPQALLDDNDSYHALQQAGDLLLTGPTGTNVADVQVLLIP